MKTEPPLKYLDPPLPRIVIPASLQKEILSKIHERHQGIQKYCLHANTSVWWPSISKHIKDLMPHQCQRTHSKQRTAKPTDLPDYPSQNIETDLFLMNEANYLVAVNHFFRYFETIKLKSTTSDNIIEGLKSLFPDKAY